MSAETIAFQTEVSELLNLMIHSLYSERDIFLRELISNAADAIDKARFEALTNNDISEPEGGWKIKLAHDEKAGTITIWDNGYGMTRDEMVQNLGTIAHSGTRSFIEALKSSDDKSRPELIGQFGVGFYSSFMVADEVVVKSRSVTGDEAHVWTSRGDGSFDVDVCQRECAGTTITLKLKEDAKEFCEEHKIRHLVKTYSNFVSHPITMDITREEVEKDEEGKPKEGAEPKQVTTEETLNAREALWRLPKNEIKPEQYNDFYKQLTFDWNDPGEIIHYRAEGANEFIAMLFIPGKKPFDFVNPEKRTTLHLYVNRVFIMKDNPDLLPEYLDFVQGVVDSSDLPLNVSREILQNNRQVAAIRKAIVGKVLTHLKTMLDKRKDDYVNFYNIFGRTFKQGVSTDFENRDKVRDLLLFSSSATSEGETITLKQYIERMPKGQKDIYYLVGANRQAIEGSPHLEVLKDKGYEVLFLTEAIDEWVMTQLRTVESFGLKNAASGDLDLESEEEKEASDKAYKEVEESYKDFNSTLKELLHDEVSDVRVSRRLKDSACCLVSAEGQMSTHMEQTLKQYGHDIPDSMKRILEINPEHPLVQSLKDLHGQNADQEQLQEYAGLLYDQALLTAGAPVRNPVAFAQKMSALLARDLKA